MTKTINRPLREDLPATDLDLLSKLVRWAHASMMGDLANGCFDGWPVWDQHTWGRKEGTQCGTVACIFGNAVVQSDDWILDIHAAGGDGWGTAHYAYPVKTLDVVDVTTGKPVRVLDADRHKRSVYEVVSQLLLRLTPEEASALSEGENSFADVVAVAWQIATDRAGILDVPEEWIEEAADETRWRSDVSNGWRHYYTVDPVDPRDDD